MQTKFNNTSFRKGRETEEKLGHGFVNARILAKRNLEKDEEYYEKLSIGKQAEMMNSKELDAQQALNIAARNMNANPHYYDDYYKFSKDQATRGNK